VTRAPRVLGMLLVAVGALVHAAVQANANVPRSVAGNGGTVATGTGRMLKGTVGQAALGRGLGVGRTLQSGFWHTKMLATVGVEPDAIPLTLSFLAPQPNPTTGGVRLSVVLPSAARVRLDVFDAAGRHVKAVARQSCDPGVHAWTWDLTSDAGDRVPTGIFFTQLRVNDRFVTSRRMVVL